MPFWPKEVGWTLDPKAREHHVNELVSSMARAIRAREALPRFPAGLDLEQAYGIQKALVAEVAGGAIAGLKAGMTAAAGQQQFGLAHPLVGSLYQSGRLSPGATFAVEPGVMLECEIGVTIDAAGHPRSAGPVIEVPRMAWGDPADATGSNLVASNIAADRFIVGEQQPMRGSYDDVVVTLTRDGETVCEAPATDALGGPLEALAWMLEEAAKRGLEIADDMLLITGALGGIHPAKPGAYVANYGAFGTIEFTVA